MSHSTSQQLDERGIPGRPGFANLFGRPVFFTDGKPEYGPTGAYQLGFVSDPTANITGIHSQSSFPYFNFSTSTGLRAANGQINDSYMQDNKVTLVLRDLWSGARIDLNWNIDWKYSRNETIQTDSIGQSTVTSVSTSGSIDRSFFTLPPTFIFSAFKSGIGEVGKEFAALQNNTGDTRTDDQKLSQAFESGFETLPLFQKILGEYMPRLNYSIHWDGLNNSPSSKISRPVSAWIMPIPRRTKPPTTETFLVAARSSMQSISATRSRRCWGSALLLKNSSKETLALLSGTGHLQPTTWCRRQRTLLKMIPKIFQLPEVLGGQGSKSRFSVFLCRMIST